MLYSIWLILNKKVGDKVNKGDLLITAYTNKTNVDDVLKEINNSFVISSSFVEPCKIIEEIIE